MDSGVDLGKLDGQVFAFKMLSGLSIFGSQGLAMSTPWGVEFGKNDGELFECFVEIFFG